MKIPLIITGILVVLVGLWPLIATMGFIPESIKFIPTTGIAYQAIVIVIGVLALLYAFNKKSVRP